LSNPTASKAVTTLKNMKKILCLFLLISAAKVLGQSDTLYMGDGKKIPCKIYEIGEYEMRYRIGGENGTLFVIDKFKVRKYTLANGYSEIVMPDELAVDNEHASIIHNREVIKIQPFGIAFNHISLAFEKVLKVGMNLDIEAGYINSDMNPAANGIFNMTNFHSGGYFKPGVKFFKGSDYVVRGMKYAHPLKGSYIKLDLAVSYLKFENVNTNIYIPGSYNQGMYTNGTTTVISTDISSVSYGGFVNFGRQVILGNLLTLDFYGGFGFTAQSNSYSNKDYLSVAKSSGYYSSNFGYDGSRISNYYGWARVPGLGLSFTCGLRLGFILPARKPARAKVSQ
jgi:hypothetical protein